MNAHQSVGREDHAPGPDADELGFRLTVDEAELVLEALGAMRYSTVYRLIAKLQTQARQQMTPASDRQVRAASADEQVPGGDRSSDPVELREVAGVPRR